MSVFVAACSTTAIAATYFILRRIGTTGPWNTTLGQLLGLTVQSKIEGNVKEGYESVRDAFARNFAEGYELGAQFVVYVKGEKVVDLCGRSEKNPVSYSADSLQNVWSSSKAVESLVVALLVDRGLLSYHAPIANYWPAFGQNGKEHITVAELMRHEAGLDILKEPLSKEVMADFVAGGSRLAQLVEQSEPAWSPESKRCYHGQSRGWIVNELVRRVDPHGRTVGRLLRECVTDPLGLSETMWLGIPGSMQPTLPLVSLHEQPRFQTLCSLILPAVLGLNPKIANQLKYLGKDSFAAKRWINKSVAYKPQPGEGPGCANAPFFLEFESPSANVNTNARSLAAVFSKITKLLSSNVLKAACETTPECLDVGIGVRTEFCHGGWAKNFFGFYPKTHNFGSGWFGWTGWGGSVIQFHPSAEVAFCYTMTAMQPSLTGDVRARRLVSALEDALLAQSVMA